MMGRVIRREVVAIRCELRSCTAEVPLEPPAPADSTWHRQLPQLGALVDAGWGFVLTPQLRAYCPGHAARVQECTCRRHPERTHLCTSHDGDAAGLVWDCDSEPDEVTRLKEVAA